MGPFKSGRDRNHVFVQEFVAGKANPRHRGPSMTEARLAQRIAAHERLDSRVREAMTRPGSQNRHKS